MPKATTPKRYAVTLDPEAAGKGMKLVSLVKSPAIGEGWVALASVAEQPTKRVHLGAADSPAKQVLTGPLLIPDLPILRIDPETQEEFYISFSAEQIEVIALRFMSEATGLALSNHNHADKLEGNQIKELWLTVSETADKAAHYGMALPVGTLMASMKVADADFWANEVETGNVTGFSIEGLFDFSELKLQAASAAPKKPMNFLTRLQAALTAAFTTTVALAAVELEDGTALEVDDATGEVFTLGEDGARGAAQPDGAYKLKGGTDFEVKDGKQVGHKPAEAPAEETAEEKLAEEAKPADNPDTEKRLTALETGIAEILKIVKKDDKPADDKADETKLSAAARARAEKDPVKLATIAVALEAVEMLDGTSVNYNPITRSLTDTAGNLLKTGYYACADGNYFKVSTDQYTYQIDSETYAKATTALSTAEAEVTRLSATVPAGQRVKLGTAPVGGNQEVNLAEMSPAKRRLYLARQAAKSE